MEPTTRACPSPSPLRPESPADMADLYSMVLDELRSRVTGRRNVPALRMLALLGVRHLAGHELLRCVVIGEPGVGKTTLVRALAECLDCERRLLRVPLPETPETTWGGGADLPDRIRGFVEEMPSVSRGSAEGMLLHLDDMDIMRLKPWESYGASDRGQREGRQRSLLSIWSGEEISAGDDWSQRFSTRRILVIGCLEGEGLPAKPDSGALVKWGLIPALAERMAMSTLVRLHPAEGHEAGIVAVREAERLAQPAYEAFGYRLSISAEAVAYALRSVEPRELSTRGLIGLLRAAADNALLELVARAAPRGTARVVGPDDV